MVPSAKHAQVQVCKPGAHCQLTALAHARGAGEGVRRDGHHAWHDGVERSRRPNSLPLPAPLGCAAAPYWLGGCPAVRHASGLLLLGCGVGAHHAASVSWALLLGKALPHLSSSTPPTTWKRLHVLGWGSLGSLSTAAKPRHIWHMCGGCLPLPAPPRRWRWPGDRPLPPLGPGTRPGCAVGAADSRCCAVPSAPKSQSLLRPTPAAPGNAAPPSWAHSGLHRTPLAPQE